MRKISEDKVSFISYISVLAQSAKSIATSRLNIVKENTDHAVIEKLINAGQVEELIMQGNTFGKCDNILAKDEISLLPVMLEDQVFDPLETLAPKGQWDSLASTSTTSGEKN